MQVELRPISSIRPYESNPRINDAAVDAVLAASITEWDHQDIRKNSLTEDELAAICRPCTFARNEQGARAVLRSHDPGDRHPGSSAIPSSPAGSAADP